MLVPTLPAQLPGSGRNDGRVRTQSGPYDHPVLRQAISPESVKRWNLFGRTAGRSRRVDETYIKVRGEWTYLYRAVDKAGQTVDFRLCSRRDVAAAKAFFVKAIQHDGRPPHTITLDGYAASHRAVREMREDGLLSKRTKLRSSKYLNNLIEQDHRGSSSEPDRCWASKVTNPPPSP